MHSQATGHDGFFVAGWRTRSLSIAGQKQTMQMTEYGKDGGPQVVDRYQSGHLGFFEEALLPPTSRAFVERLLYGFADVNRRCESGGAD